MSKQDLNQETKSYIVAFKLCTDGWEHYQEIVRTVGYFKALKRIGILDDVRAVERTCFLHEGKNHEFKRAGLASDTKLIEIVRTCLRKEYDLLWAVRAKVLDSRRLEEIGLINIGRDLEARVRVYSPNK